MFGNVRLRAGVVALAVVLVVSAADPTHAGDQRAPVAAAEQPAGEREAGSPRTPPARLRVTQADLEQARADLQTHMAAVQKNLTRMYPAGDTGSLGAYISRM